ncbi:MAG: hypothetical protein KAQ87_05200 [Candidatus Pacebacteria bacterium]|nr:hypothetical protein [Candidatus Paceibacterota bacterium]
MKRENKKAYMLAAGIGTVAGFLMTIFFHTDIVNIFNNFKYVGFFVFGNLSPIFILIFLFILSKKIPVAWENVKTRMISVLILSVVCMYSYTLSHLIMNGDGIYKIFFLPIWMFVGAIIQCTDSLKSFSLVAFVYLNVFIVIAAYLTTKGIKNPKTKVILFFLIGFLIHITATIPLIIMRTHT